MPLFLPVAKDNDFFAARMTEAQFGALKAFMPIDRAVKDAERLASTLRRRKVDPSTSAEIRKWLFNGWNTEHILAMSDSLIDGVGGAILQWAFPQSYYSCFASLNAFNAARGTPEIRHHSLIKRFANDAKSGFYPAGISFGVDSTIESPQYFGISNPSARMHSLSFDHESEASVAQQIVQFLRSTRKTELRNRKEQYTKMRKGSPIQLKSGRPRVKYRKQDWDLVAKRVGPTALLNLLYRKRIKSNYRDIDTYTAEAMDPAPVQTSLRHIVFVFSAVHEIMLTGLIGKDAVLGHASGYISKVRSAPVAKRLGILQSL